MNPHWRILGVFGVVVILLAAAYLSFGIPIACGSNGCIRNAEAISQEMHDRAFARSTNGHEPNMKEILTTVVRRYLLAHASITSIISISDAARYRTEVLHATDISALEKLGFSSFEEYDKLVLIPFLQQQALMKQRRIESPSALYAQLAQEQSIFLFKNGYRWNTATGEVVAK